MREREGSRTLGRLGLLGLMAIAVAVVGLALGAVISAGAETTIDDPGGQDATSTTTATTDQVTTPPSGAATTTPTDPPTSVPTTAPTSPPTTAQPPGPSTSSSPQQLSTLGAPIVVSSVTIDFTGQGTTNGDCNTMIPDAGVAAGTKVWQFNLNGVDNPATATMSAVFSDPTSVTGTISPTTAQGKSAHWLITTADTATVVSASATYDGLGNNPQFVVSHCLVATTGSLMVVKSVVGSPPSNTTFTVHVDCNDGSAHDRSLTFDSAGTLTGGGPLPITGIPGGTSCTVTEPGTGSADDVLVTGSPATIVAGQTKQVTVINTFGTATGNLTVVKSVVGSAPGATTFTVGVNCDDGTSHDRILTFDAVGTLIAGGPLPITGIPDDTSCTVTETGTGNADGVQVTGSPATIAGGQTGLVTVTNTFDAPDVGSFRVRKVIGQGHAPPGTQFVVDVECTLDSTIVYSDTTTFTSPNDLGPHTFDNLPLGAVCSATEESPFGGAFRHDDGTPVTIVSSSTPTITVTNDFDPGQVQVRKAIAEGTPANGTQFVVSVDCTLDGVSVDGYPKTTTFTYPGDLGPHVLNTLPLGAVCSATEASPYGGASSHDNGATVTIESEATIPLVTVTNSFPGPPLIVSSTTGIQVGGASVTRALPFTGSSSEVLAKTGAWLVLVGAALVLLARRGRAVRPG
jgi:hypothetical protein